MKKQEIKDYIFHVIAQFLFRVPLYSVMNILSKTLIKYPCGNDMNGSSADHVIGSWMPLVKVVGYIAPPVVLSVMWINCHEHCSFS